MSRAGSHSETGGPSLFNPGTEYGVLHDYVFEKDLWSYFVKTVQNKVKEFKVSFFVIEAVENGKVLEVKVRFGEKTDVLSLSFPSSTWGKWISE